MRSYQIQIIVDGEPETHRELYYSLGEVKNKIQRVAKSWRQGGISIYGIKVIDLGGE